MNKVILMGRLTRDPEIRSAQNGPDLLTIARFTLAVNRRQISSAARHLVRRQISSASIRIKERSCAWKAGLRQEVILSRMVQRYIPQRWLLRVRNLQSLKQPMNSNHITLRHSRTNSHNRHPMLHNRRIMASINSNSTHHSISKLPRTVFSRCRV